MIQATHSASPNARVSSLADQHYRALVHRLQVASVQSRLEGTSNGEEASHVSVGAIGITSSRRGEGVSTVAANLVVAASEMSLGPVLLVDANLQHPNIARMFGLNEAKDAKGFVDALQGQDVHDLVIPTSVQNLSVMLPGDVGQNGQLLNERSAIRGTIEQLRDDFEWIIFDLPPATELSECFALSGQLDSVLMVIQADGPPRESVRRACHELEIAGANVLGAVLNKRK